MWFVTKYNFGIRFFFFFNFFIFYLNTIIGVLLCEAKLQASLVSF